MDILIWRRANGKNIIYAKNVFISSYPHLVKKLPRAITSSGLNIRAKSCPSAYRALDVIAKTAEPCEAPVPASPRFLQWIPNRMMDLRVNYIAVPYAGFSVDTFRLLGPVGTPGKSRVT